MRLPRTQAAILERVERDSTVPIDDLAARVEVAPETATRAAFELAEEGLVSVEAEAVESVSLTDEGRRYVRESLPEQDLYGAAMDLDADEDPVELGEAIGVAGLAGEAVDIALSNYARKGYGTIESGELTADPSADPGSDAEMAALEAVADGREADAEVAALDHLERRGLLARTERTVRRVGLTAAGEAARAEGVEVAETVGEVTPELLTSGEWRDAEFAAYDVEAEADAPGGGKKHVLRGMADRVKDVLVGMGFAEMEGPHVDAQFWINDCLFMPQDHPARTHWDQFALSNPERTDALPADLVERVESAHRSGVGDSGEGYHSPWTESVARSLDLRGHTTSLSMRYLSGHAAGDLDPPERYFSVEKVYRNDTLDPTHLLEFFQIEGWVLAEDLSVRDLMGTFTEFYEHFGITDLEFKPHYNPYTEPSFELFGTHPETGDIVEVGNSGLFREEVLEPLGVEADVMAWGLSLERLLMLVYGFEDIRDVHGTLCDLDLLRDTAVVY